MDVHRREDPLSPDQEEAGSTRTVRVCSGRRGERVRSYSQGQHCIHRCATGGPRWIFRTCCQVQVLTAISHQESEHQPRASVLTFPLWSVTIAGSRHPQHESPRGTSSGRNSGRTRPHPIEPRDTVVSANRERAHRPGWRVPEISPALVHEAHKLPGWRPSVREHIPEGHPTRRRLA